MRNFEAVTFDLWQTLVLDNRELGRARTALRLQDTLRILANAGYEFSYDQLQEAYRSCYRSCRTKHALGEDYSFDEQVNIFIDNIDQNLTLRLNQETIDSVISCYAEAFFDFPPLIAPGAREVLSHVVERGYKVGLISNTGMTPGRLFRRYLAEHNMLDFFSTLTFSDEVKLTKPTNEIFLITLNNLGTTPDRAIHIGDHIQNDVLGANEVGMISILVGSAEGQEKVAEPDAQVLNLEDIPQALEKILLV